MAVVEQKLEPLRVSVDVPLSQDRAFALFTEKIDSWWPLDAYAVHRDRAEACVLEPQAGGRVYERSKEGDEYLWAEVVVFERPRRLVLSWHPTGRNATELEITFTPSDSGTLVELEHRNWEAFADLAEQARTEYRQGWALVLEDRFAAAARKLAAEGERHV